MVTSPCRLYMSTTGGTDPESWQEVDGRTRLIAISPIINARKALEESARLDIQVTHIGRAEYDEELQSKRLLKRLSDGRYFLIERVDPVGRVRRDATHAPRVRLALSVHNIGEDL